jgi:hypothetical protein
MKTKENPLDGDDSEFGGVHTKRDKNSDQYS